MSARTVEREVCIYTPQFDSYSPSYQAETLKTTLQAFFQMVGVDNFELTSSPDHIPQLLTDKSIVVINGNSDDYSAHHLVSQLRQSISPTVPIMVFLDPPHHYLEGGCREAGADIVFRLLPPHDEKDFITSMNDILEISKRNRLTVYISHEENRDPQVKAA